MMNREYTNETVDIKAQQLEELIATGGSMEEIAALCEELFAAEGMPAEPPVDENLQVLGEHAARVVDNSEDPFAAAFETEYPEDALAITPAVFELEDDEPLVSRLREKGYAATLEETNPSEAQLFRLADAGVAYLRADGKETVLAMAGATDGDVRKAGARARADKVERRFEEDVRTCEKIARAIIARARKLTLSNLNELPNLFAPVAPREAVDAVIRQLGCGASEDPRATDQEIDEAIDRAREIDRHTQRQLSRKDKTFADGISGSEGEYDSRPTMLEYVRGRAALMGPDAAHAALSERLLTFQAEAGNLKYAERCALLKRHFPFGITLSEAFGWDGELAEWIRSRTGTSPFSKASTQGLQKAARRGAENARGIRRAASGPRASRIESWKPGLKFRRRAGRIQRSARTLSGPEAQKAAWNTARATFLAGLDLKHRVLYLVARDQMVSLEDLKDRFGALDGGLRKALRVLVRANKVRPVRRKSDGEVFVKALIPFDAEAHKALFLAEIRDPANGIPARPTGASAPTRKAVLAAA